MTGYNKVFLDTSPIIYRIEKNTEFYEAINSFITNNSDSAYYTSTITVEEYSIYPIRENKEELIDAFDAFVSAMEVEIIDVDRAIAMKAAKLRAEFNQFKSMDALQLAAAVVTGCDCFLTNDKQLKQFGELDIILVGEL